MCILYQELDLKEGWGYLPEEKTNQKPSRTQTKWAKTKTDDEKTTQPVLFYLFLLCLLERRQNDSVKTQQLQTSESQNH